MARGVPCRGSRVHLAFSGHVPLWGGSKKVGVPRQEQQERNEQIHGSDLMILSTNSAPETRTTDRRHHPIPVVVILGR